MHPLLRVLGGVIALAATALLMRAAMMRLVRGAALLFGAAIALVTAALLLGGALWALFQRLRRHRGGADEEGLAGFDLGPP